MTANLSFKKCKVVEINNMKQRIVLAGGSGFLGTALANYLKEAYEIVVLSRKKGSVHDGIKYVQWDGKSLGAWQQEIEGAFAVMNMSGRSVDCRYNEQNKKEIYASRLDSTAVLGEAIKRCLVKPEIWMNAASATIYKYSIDKPMTERNGEMGSGFSVDVCQQWEAMFAKYKVEGVKQIGLRISIVFGYKGGAMEPLKRLVKLGLGGKAGNGDQMVSWIHITDFCNAINHLLKNNHANGAYNLASPYPIPNKTFMKTFREVLKMPFGLNQPKWLLEIGAFFIRTETELILKSRFVIPEKLEAEGFKFNYPTIDVALKDLTK
jgi:uncharacterized protein (TIGR01777 family)